MTQTIVVEELDWDDYADVNFCRQDKAEKYLPPTRPETPMPFAFVAKMGSVAVGCIVVSYVEGKSFPTIVRLYVRPDAHGRRLGRYLFDAALTHCSEYGYWDTLEHSEIASDITPQERKNAELFV